MGIKDLLGSERALMTLLFLGVLAALMFTHADRAMIEMWAQYAGGVVSVYNVAKSLLPGAKAKEPAGTAVANVPEQPEAGSQS